MKKTLLAFLSLASSMYGYSHTISNAPYGIAWDQQTERHALISGAAGLGIITTPKEFPLHVSFSSGVHCSKGVMGIGASINYQITPDTIIQGSIISSGGNIYEYNSLNGYAIGIAKRY